MASEKATAKVKELLAELDAQTQQGAQNPRCQFLVNEIDALEQKLFNAQGQAQLQVAIAIEALRNQLLSLGCTHILQ